MDIRKRLSGWVALAVFATIGGAGGAMVAADPAFAKVDVDKLTIDGEARMRYEVRVGTFFGTNTAAQAPGTNGHANESAASHRVRIGVGYDLTPDVSFYAQVQDARVWGSECVASGGAAGTCASTTGIGTVSSTNQNGNGVDLHQGYIQLKNVLVPGLGLKIGRQELIYGDHRLFGNFGWSQVGNSFDAAKIMWNSDMVDLDLFWARIIDTEIAAGCSSSAVTFANGNCSGVIFPANGSTATTDQDIYAAYLTLKPVKGWTIEPYYILLKDSRFEGAAGGSALTAAQATDQARNFLGTRINGKAGGLDLTLEADWQFGGISNNGASPIASANTGQHDLHINAEQAAARIGYTFEPVPMRPRIGFEVDYASGDPCSNGPNVLSGCNNALNGHANLADNLYPTNHFHYGYMDLMSWRNMVGYSAMFDVKPSSVSKLQFNFWLLRLARTQDNWYRASQGIYAVSLASNQAASLGKELDIHYWHTFKEKFLLEIGAGKFWSGEYVEKNITQVGVQGPGIGPASTATFNSVGNQTWGYVMGSVKF